MRSLSQQFDGCLAEVYSRDKEQRLILMHLMSDYYRNEELIDYVAEKVMDGSFKMGDDGKEFFCRCADEIFKMKLAKRKGPGNHEDLKNLHPLWGASWWTT